MGKLEHSIEKKLKKAVEEIGGITRKWVSPGHTGVPDQIVIYKGHVFFVEVKTYDGKLSSNQEREIKRLQEHGAKTVVLYGEGSITGFIEAIKIIAEV